MNVRFSETFISDGYTDDELRVIAQFLAENPRCGTPSKEVEHLFWVTWPNRTKEDRTTRRIWFLWFAGLPDIEVIAMTTNSDSAADDPNWKKIGWKILRIYMLIRTLIRLGKWLTGDDDVDDVDDDDDHIDDMYGEF
jgi:hypothetical protein